MRRILAWILLCSALPGVAEPPYRLHIELHTYEGIEYTCHVQEGRVWYEFAGKKLKERALKPQEVAAIKATLLKQRFRDLPSAMVRPSIDSRDTLTVWQGKKSKEVVATIPYQGPLQADYLRFQAIERAIRQIAPIPSAEILRQQPL